MFIWDYDVLREWKYLDINIVILTNRVMFDMKGLVMVAWLY